MNIKEAVALLERYSNYNGMGIPNLAGCKEAMKVAVESLKEAYPELEESEDERIRKFLVDYFTSYKIGNVTTKLNGYRIDDIIAYLEKQKDASKAIEAVDRIDKYIDERLANAHDMKDSNPDKKYYRGWDDALGKMAGILQDVYSGEKQKEQKPAEHKAFEEWAEDYWSHNKVNNPYSYNKGDEIQFDHKGFVSFCEAYCYPQNLVLHDTFGYEEGRQTGRNEGVKLVLNNPEKYGLQKEQKPADLSEMMVHKEPYIAPVPTPMVADEQKPAAWSEDWREEDIQTRFAFYTYKDDPSVLYLSNVFVEETSRNHGFGTRILRAAEKVAETIGATIIILKVKHDSPANAWYRKHGYGCVAFEDGYDWLEKNLEYMNPDKQEWSEEDKETIDLTIAVLKENLPNGYFKTNPANTLNMGAIHTDELINRLKSLRPVSKESLQPHWKPSEGQMKVLAMFSNLRCVSRQEAATLESLYNDLKKRM